MNNLYPLLDPFIGIGFLIQFITFTGYFANSYLMALANPNVDSNIINFQSVYAKSPVSL